MHEHDKLMVKMTILFLLWISYSLLVASLLRAVSNLDFQLHLLQVKK